MEIHFRNKVTKEEYKFYYDCWVDCYGKVISTYETENDEGILSTEIEEHRGLEAYIIVNKQEFVICSEAG